MDPTACHMQQLPTSGPFAGGMIKVASPMGGSEVHVGLWFRYLLCRKTEQWDGICALQPTQLLPHHHYQRVFTSAVLAFARSILGTAEWFRVAGTKSIRGLNPIVHSLTSHPGAQERPNGIHCSEVDSDVQNGHLPDGIERFSRGAGCPGRC